MTMPRRPQAFAHTSPSQRRDMASGMASRLAGVAGAKRASIRVAAVGTYAPRQCGIAVFSQNIVEQLRRFNPEIAMDIYALDDAKAPLDYGARITRIDSANPQDFVRAAQMINDSAVDAVWLQHEYGLFGGVDGDMACDFVDRLAPPLILTCHTVLASPTAGQEKVLRRLVSRASRIMVMSRDARRLVIEKYDAPADVATVIEHGAPDRPFGRQSRFKRQLGHGDRPIMMTFGLLGPGKGIEHALRALPAIVARHPNVLYRIVGATHPNLLARETGEKTDSYRDQLVELAEALGVADNVEWVNRFLDMPELLDQLEACDIYITPFPGMQQSTSGTLSYAVALGKAVIATPYAHARELLRHDVGRLITPRSSSAIAEAVNALLDCPEDLRALQLRAYARGRDMIWPRFADAAARLIREARAASPALPSIAAAPALGAVFRMSDSTGILQHAIGVVPDRRHGYCLDDNARALMLMNRAAGIAVEDRQRWRMIYASFVQHAWNEDIGRFRNFMRFDRTWCEEFGSDDSNGRALWALGQTAALANDRGMADWAAAFYDRVAPVFAAVTSPRAVAFAMLGAGAMLLRAPNHPQAIAQLERGGDLLQRLLARWERPDWPWFEPTLAYDNARLPQVLIEAGSALGRQDWLDAGLDALEWIFTRQTAADGAFRPVGSQTFAKPGGAPGTAYPFDQQPLEAQAAIEAAAAAFRATQDPRWVDRATTAWLWFFGMNDRGVALGDLASGLCRDGVTPRGVNANCGAESVLAFQLGHCGMAALLASAFAENSASATGERQEIGV